MDLTSAYPRGVWGKLNKFSTFMWSNQESIRTGPGRARLGIRPPQFGGILLQSGERVKTSQILHRIVAGMSHNYPGFAGPGQGSFDRAKKFQSKEAHLPDGILAQHLGCDWWGL